VLTKQSKNATRKPKVSILFLLPLLLAVLPLAAQLPPPAPPVKTEEVPAEAALALRLEEIVRQPDADRGLWGIEVYAPARGRALYALNAERYFIPASVTKLFTTAAALALAGPDYHFHTVAGARTHIDSSGRLAGNLFLVGGGDPDLAGCTLPYTQEKKENNCRATAVLDELAAQVAANGVREVAGELVLDQSFFAPEPYPPGWTAGDLLWSYGAPVRALSLGDNTLTLKVEPAEFEGARAHVTWEPPTRFYQVLNQTWTAASGTAMQLYLRRDPGSRTLEVSGPVPLGSRGRTVEVAIEEPTEVVGELFRAALERSGVRVLGETEARFQQAPPFAGGEATALPIVLAEHNSRPLLDAVTYINKMSQNLYAEMLLRLLGRQPPPSTGAPERPRRPFEPPARRGDGSTEAGLEALRAWLFGAGLNPDDVQLSDGSGLTRRSLVTPHAVVQLLLYADKQPWGALLRDSLPVSGVDGTLADRMKNSHAQGRVRAKTGGLGNTAALAGYLETRAGEPLVFAIFLNHYTLDDRRATELIDQLCAALVDLPEDETRKSKIETR